MVNKHYNEGDKANNGKLAEQRPAVAKTCAYSENESCAWSAR